MTLSGTVILVSINLFSMANKKNSQYLNMDIGDD